MSKQENKKTKLDDSTQKVMRYRLIRYKKMGGSRNIKAFSIVIIPVGLIIAIAIMGQFIGTENVNNPPQDNTTSVLYQTQYTFQTTGGQSIKLSDHQGKVVILLFISTSCPACPDEATIVASIDDDYSSSQVYIVPVCTDPSVSDIDLRNWLDNYNTNWPAVRDDIQNTDSSYFNIQSIPTVKILDKNGYIISTMVGTAQGSYNNIKTKVNSLL